MDTRDLAPKILWNHFLDLNEVPRPSKKEEKVRTFIREFAKSLNLPFREDAVGNIVIEKHATPGMENRQKVILQSHVDMVHQKNSDTDFDFDNDPIQSYIDGDWLKAKGTTLGADNGIGVAASMAVLSSKDIAHPAIEALFTVDEEAGMTGAKNLQSGFLTGEILFNMDSEDEGELTIGCAGGIDTNVSLLYQEMDLPQVCKCFELSVTGLFGGHSGVDIHLQRGNANKILNRILLEATETLGIYTCHFTGGNLRNAIPREAFATIAVEEEKIKDLQDLVEKLTIVFKENFKTTDKDLKISLKATSICNKAISPQDGLQILRAVNACPNGVYRWSMDVEGLVETSNNLAFVEAKESYFNTKCLTRSAVDENRNELAQIIRSCFAQIGANVEHSGEYNGWEPNINSPMLEVAKKVHQDVYGYAPKIMIIHAGLENGIILKSHPHLDSISFGPTIKFPHSPDEKVNIPTVQRFWEYLKALLLEVPTN